MLRFSCSPLLHNPTAVLAAHGGAPPSIRRPFSVSAFGRNATSPAMIEKQSPATAYSIPAADLGKRIKIQPSAELGLLSILFVLSMAIGAITSVALISIPTASAMKRLAVSMQNLASLASESAWNLAFTQTLSSRDRRFDSTTCPSQAMDLWESVRRQQ